MGDAWVPICSEPPDTTRTHPALSSRPSLVASRSKRPRIVNVLTAKLASSFQVWPAGTTQAWPAA